MRRASSSGDQAVEGLSLPMVDCPRGRTGTLDCGDTMLDEEGYGAVRCDLVAGFGSLGIIIIGRYMSRPDRVRPRRDDRCVRRCVSDYLAV